MTFSGAVLRENPYIAARISLGQVNQGMQQLRGGVAIRTVIEFP